MVQSSGEKKVAFLCSNPITKKVNQLSINIYSTLIGEEIARELFNYMFYMPG